MNNKNLKVINHRDLKHGQRETKQTDAIFDLTKLKDYPLRLLKVKENEDEKKILYFTEMKDYELFNKHSKYVVIGELNRTDIVKEFIVETYEQLFNAIELYVAKSLFRRIDPLDYFLVGVDRIYELRPYKRMLGRLLPISIELIE